MSQYIFLSNLYLMINFLKLNQEYNDFQHFIIENNHYETPSLLEILYTIYKSTSLITWNMYHAFNWFSVNANWNVNNIDPTICQ